MNKFYTFYLITGVLLSALIFNINYVVMEANANLLSGILKSIPVMASTVVGMLSTVNEGIESSFGIYDKLTGKEDTDSQSSTTTDSQVTEISDLKKQVSQLENQISMLSTDEKAIADKEFSKYFAEEIKKKPEYQHQEIIENLGYVVSPDRVHAINMILQAHNNLHEVLCSDVLRDDYGSIQECKDTLYKAKEGYFESLADSPTAYMNNPSMTKEKNQHLNLQNEVRDEDYINKYGSNTFEKDYPSNNVLNSEPPGIDSHEDSKKKSQQDDTIKADVPNLRV